MNTIKLIYICHFLLLKININSIINCNNQQILQNKNTKIYDNNEIKKRVLQLDIFLKKQIINNNISFLLITKSLLLICKLSILLSYYVSFNVCLGKQYLYDELLFCYYGGLYYHKNHTDIFFFLFLIAEIFLIVNKNNLLQDYILVFLLFIIYLIIKSFLYIYKYTKIKKTSPDIKNFIIWNTLFFIDFFTSLFENFCLKSISPVYNNIFTIFFLNFIYLFFHAYFIGFSFSQLYFLPLYTIWKINTANKNYTNLNNYNNQKKHKLNYDNNQFFL